jgi:hypothetical protein
MAGERHGRGMLCVNPPLAYSITESHFSLSTAFVCRLTLIFLEPSGPAQAFNGFALHFYISYVILHNDTKTSNHTSRTWPKWRSLTAMWLHELERGGGGGVVWSAGDVIVGRLRLKCDGTRAKTRFCLSARGTSPFKSAGASVHSTTGSRRVCISGSNAGYIMFRDSVNGTGYPFHSPVSPSLPYPCVTFQLDSTGRASVGRHWKKAAETLDKICCVRSETWTRDIVHQTVILLTRKQSCVLVSLYAQHIHHA